MTLLTRILRRGFSEAEGDLIDSSSGVAQEVDREAVEGFRSHEVLIRSGVQLEEELVDDSE